MRYLKIKNIKHDSESLDNIEYSKVYTSSVLSPLNGYGFSFHEDFTELAMVINAIDENKDSEFTININESYLKFNKALVESCGVVLGGIEIEKSYPLSFHYAPHLENNWKDEDVKDFYGECSDKFTLLPKEFLDECKKWKCYDISSITLYPEASDRIMGNFYDLHRNGYNLTKFGAMTWYPMATLFVPLAMWRS